MQIEDPNSVPRTVRDRHGRLHPRVLWMAWGKIFRGKVQVLTGSFYPRERRWVARIAADPRQIMIGVFDDKAEAARAARTYYVRLPLNRRANSQAGSWCVDIDWNSSPT